MSDENRMSEDLTQTRRVWSWTRAILAVSLTLNLLVAGLVIGAHVRDDRDTRRFPPEVTRDRSALRDLGYGPIVDALPEGYRDEIGRALAERGGSFTENRARIVAEVTAMLAALREDPYKSEPLRLLLEEQHDRVSQRAIDARELILGAIEEMTPEERHEFADHFEALLRHAARNRAPMPPSQP